MLIICAKILATREAAPAEEEEAPKLAGSAQKEFGKKGQRDGGTGVLQL